MNQILENKTNNIKKDYSTSSNIKNFKIIFWICIFVILTSIIFYFFLKYNALKKEEISKSLLNNFKITTLYSDTSNYTASKTSKSLEKKEPFVIGLVKIDKINLLYPILSVSTAELLKISPCRFYGPLPNEIGNLCIAGHNYVDNKLFSKLNLLNKGDIIEIYDLTGTHISYKIYEKKEVSVDDTSCAEQNTNGAREVTLVTCNNVKGTRVVVKAKEGVL